MRLVLILCLVVFLGACAKQPHSKDPKEALLERVKAYWDLRLQGASAEKRLPFERCGLDPKCREAFLQGGGKGGHITYYNYQILGVRFPDPKTALVKIKVRYKVPPILGVSFEREGSFEDKWVLIDGEWYHVIKGFAKEW